MHSYDFSNHFYLTCVRCNTRATRAGGSLSGWMAEDGFQSAMMVRPVCPECAQGDEKRIPYGYCPVCGAIGLYRERRPDGDDVCANGHTYKSSSALKFPHQPPPVPVEVPDDYVQVPRAALLEVLRISDRKHYAWDAVKAAVAAPQPAPVELPLPDKIVIELARSAAACLLGIGCTTSAEAISEVCDRLEKKA